MKHEHLLTIVWTSAVAGLLLAPPGWFASPGVEEVAGLPYADKLLHVVLFGVLCFLATRSLRRLGVRRPLLVAVLATVAFGGAIELLQPLAERSCELGDAVADGGGALLTAVRWPRQRGQWGR